MTPEITHFSDRATSSPGSTFLRSTGTQSSGNPSKAGSDSGAITSNDFLTLLVTEMKNQDPTANTDPNEYINQLVQVNSLQQLIAINSTLQEGLGLSPSPDPRPSPDTKQSAPLHIASPNNASAKGAHPLQPGSPIVTGNLTAPPAKPDAIRVAQALSNPSAS